MSGGGIGGALGTGLGVLLAPETGGLSMAIPALAGAAGAGLGGALTGSKNPLMDALMGGIGGGLTGGLSGGFDAANLFGDASGAAGVGADTAGAGALSDAGQMGYVGGMPESVGSGAASSSSFLPSWLGGASSGVPSAADASGVGASGIPASVGSSDSSGIMNYLGKQNPLNLALAGATGLSAIDSLLPKPKVNVGQNAANVMATNPNFNASLPQYSLQNNGTPYTGDWYKYGASPQVPMYSGQLIPQAAKRGGLIGHYADGGKVHGYAMGGVPMAPQGAPPSSMPPQMGQPPMPAAQPQKPVNPLMLMAAHKIGVALGKRIRNGGHTPDGQVHGKGGGQDDAIPAKLSQDEYIVPSEAVSQLGDGSSNAGAKKLDQMVHNIRAHKTSKGSAFPPKAKNPLSYLKES